MPNTSPEYLVLSVGEFSLWQRLPHAKGGWVSTSLGEKPSAILAVLRMADGAVKRATLSQMLWPGAPEGKARNCLRQALFRVRRRLGPGCVQELLGALRLVDDGVRSELEPAGAEWRAAVEQARGARPRLQLVKDDDEAVGRELWRERVQEFLNAPRADVEAAELSVVEAELADAAEAVDEPVQALKSPEDVGDAERIRASLPSNATFLTLDLGSAPIDSPSEAACCLVRQLWEVPGAVGVSPLHRDVLLRCQGGTRVSAEALWTAIEDLLAAIAEDGPVVIQVAHPERWPRIVLRRLSAVLDRLRHRPLTLVGGGVQLPSSYGRSASAPALDVVPAPDSRRDSPRAARP